MTDCLMEHTSARVSVRRIRIAAMLMFWLCLGMLLLAQMASATGRLAGIEPVKAA